MRGLTIRQVGRNRRFGRPQRGYWRPLIGLLLGVALVAAIACSSDDEEAPASGPPSTSAPSGTVSTAAPQPTTEVQAPPVGTGPRGTLTVAISDISFPATVPSTTPVRPGGFLQAWRVYETPFVWSADGPIIDPLVATEWEVNDAGTEFTITIRKGVQFHGGWGEVTADDFIWSFEDEISDDSIHSNIGVARELDATMTKIDDYTVKLTISRPNIFFFNAYMTNTGGGQMPVVSRKRVEELGAEAANLDLSGGTGPYKFVKWNPGNEAELVVFDDYYGDLPQFQTVRILEIKEAATQVAALESGLIDAAIIPAPLAASINAVANLSVSKAGIPGAFRIYPQGNFCMKTTLDGEPLDPYPRPAYDPDIAWIGDCDDPQSQANANKVRRAMSESIDRQTIVDTILGGFGRPSYLPEVTGPLLERIYKDKWFIPYDPENSKKLLAEAGWPDGFDVTLRVTTGSHPLEVEIGLAVAQYLSAIGLNVQTTVLTYSGNRPGVVSREQNDLWMRSAGGGGAEPPELVLLRRSPENAFNPGFERVEPLLIIRKMDTVKNEAELDVLRDELYDWFSETQTIIPVVLADQLLAVNTDLIGEWKRSTGRSGLTDFDKVENVGG